MDDIKVSEIVEYDKRRVRSARIALMCNRLAELDEEIESATIEVRYKDDAEFRFRWPDGGIQRADDVSRNKMMSALYAVADLRGHII